MVCKTCGNPLNEHDKFCRVCGTVVEQEAYSNPFESTGDSYTPRYGAKPPKKRRKGLLIGGIVGAVVLVLAAVAALLVFNSPRVRVASALAASVKEYSAVGKAVGLGQSADLMKKTQLSQEIDVKIRSMNEDYFGYGASSLNGMGFRLEADVNLDGREMGMRLVPYLGSADLCSLTLAAEDEVVYFAFPEIFPDPCYGINTVTMMQDLEAMGADLGDYAGVSFNYFDIVELIRSRTAVSEEAEEKLTEAGKTLVEKMELEKKGSESIRINGTETKCTVYKVTFSKSSLRQFISALENAYGSTDTAELTEEVLTQMHFPQADIDELLWQMDVSSENPYDALYDLVDEIGDLELELCISGGKISAVRFEDTIYDSEVELGLYFGGKGNYVDNFSLKLIVDDDELSLVSRGDHDAKKGTFTDETVITIPYENDLTITTEYAPGDGILSMELSQGNSSFSLEGTLVSRQDRLELDIENLSLRQAGEKIMTMSLRYQVTDYSRRVSLQGARMLSDMTQDDVLEIANSLEGNAVNWIIGLAAAHPELSDLF